MHRVFPSVLGFGLLLAVFATTSPYSGEVDSAGMDRTACAADVDLPLRIELETPGLVLPSVRERAVCRVTSSRMAERVELILRGSEGVILSSPTSQSREAVAGGREIEFDIVAAIDGTLPRGTVDVVATVWIDGLPYERGATWSLATQLPPMGRVVHRDGRLPVREVRVGRTTR